MSQSARNTAFLQEMGIGVQWTLRHGAEEAAVVADPFVTAVQALADTANTPRQATEPFSAPPAAISASDAAEPLAVQPSADALPPPAAMPAVAAPAPAGSKDDMSWFDDAPVPPPAAMPARPTPAAQPPVRPAAQTSARPAAVDTPSFEDESTAWFDDAPTPARAEPVSEEAIAAMDWSALKTAVASCTRCPLCETRRIAINGRGASNARFIAISAAPTQQDEKDGQPMSAEAGQLLHNMMKAIELQPETEVYITSLVKCRPSAPDGADRNPTAEEVLACRPFLARELALSGATMAMTFGQFAAKGLMMGPAARGKVMHYGAQQLPVVATYHPDDLLRKPEDKAKAWADLCLAKASHG